MTVPRAIALVCLLVFAGCANPLGGEGTPTETTTPPLMDDASTDTPTPTPTATPIPVTGTPSADELPPGISMDGIINASELLLAHANALGPTGFVAVGNGSSVVQRTGLLIDVESTQYNRVAANASAYELRREATAGPLQREVDTWSNGSIEYERTQEDGDTNYTVAEPRPVPVLTGNGLLGPYVRGGDYEVREFRNESDEGTFVVLATDEINNVTELEKAITDDAEEVTDFTAVAVVDEDGRIHSLNATIEYVINGQSANQTLDYELKTIGDVEIQRPDWVDEAEAAVNETA